MQAGHDSTNAEIISNDYSVSSTPISDVSHLGPHIYRHCEQLETFHLRLDRESHGKNMFLCSSTYENKVARCLPQILLSPSQKVVSDRETVWKYAKKQYVAQNLISTDCIRPYGHAT